MLRLCLVTIFSTGVAYSGGIYRKKSAVTLDPARVNWFISEGYSGCISITAVGKHCVRYMYLCTNKITLAYSRHFYELVNKDARMYPTLHDSDPVKSPPPNQSFVADPPGGR